MASIKADIRLDKVRIRQLKKSYKSLKPEEYKLVKLDERFEQLDKDEGKFWRYIKRDEDGYASQEGNNWEFFNWVKKEKFSILRKQSRLQEKHNWTDADVMKILRRHMQNNVHSVSYG